MLIKCKPFASPTVCAKMWSRFADRGIDSDRVDLVSLLPTTSEHLDSYSNVDLAVDTFPYAGTTTTCEALYCGVPVVTFQRKDFPNHAHNVGATLLSRIKGMEKLIANSEQEVSTTDINGTGCEHTDGALVSVVFSSASHRVFCCVVFSTCQSPCLLPRTSLACRRSARACDPPCSAAPCVTAERSSRTSRALTKRSGTDTAKETNRSQATKTQTEASRTPHSTIPPSSS